VRVLLKESVGDERMYEMLMIKKECYGGRRRLDIYLDRMLAFTCGCRHLTSCKVWTA
jgi:hypothetical protein